jgi:hypothetical protein
MPPLFIIIFFVGFIMVLVGFSWSASFRWGGGGLLAAARWLVVRWWRQSGGGGGFPVGRQPGGGGAEEVGIEDTNSSSNCVSRNRRGHPAWRNGKPRRSAHLISRQKTAADAWRRRGRNLSGSAWRKPATAMPC